MTNEDLEKLGVYVADALIKKAMMTSGEDWLTHDSRDHMVGELARCVTLQNIYLDREEYEKCAVMKIKIEKLTDKLNITEEFNQSNEEGERDDEA
jgi:hypothetical protein